MCRFSVSYRHVPGKFGLVFGLCLLRDVQNLLGKMKRFAIFSAVAVAFFLCGCDTVSSAYTSAKTYVFGEPERVDMDSEVLATYFDGPKVRPGVALAISITSSGTQGVQAKQYFVDAEGYISMELVGRVKCDGLTLIGLQEKIANAYREYYLEPNVTATFVTGGGAVSPWGTVTVLGEVGRPGPVDMPATMDLRVTRALQLAGGASPLADKRRIQVTRCDKDGRQTKTRVNLIEIGEDGRPDKDMLLKAGDVVWVPTSWY